MYKKIKLLLIGIIVVVVLVCVIPFFLVTGLFILKEVRYAQNVAKWRERTNPISSVIANDMCIKLEIAPDDWRCQLGAKVYAPDFFKEINKKFIPSKQNQPMYDDVEAILGNYEYYREPMTKVSNGLVYFVIYYDLNEDHMYPIKVFIKKDGTVFRVIANVTP